MSTPQNPLRAALAANFVVLRSIGRDRVRSIPAGSVFAGLVAVLLLVVAGCGGGAEGRKAVSGTVTMNGTPLNDATIEFTPLSEDAKSFAGATLFDGKYNIPARRGLVPGEYKVVISMGGSTPEIDYNEPPGDPMEVPAAPELIPAKYSSESQLTAKVEANGDNRFDFELEK